MDNDFKLTVRLRQYTPLLHFQGGTEGACLRASEVKPKLDRFVMAHCAVPEAWKLKVDDNAEALRYKMRFSAPKPPEIQENYSDKYKKDQIHSLYFAAMGDEESGVWDSNGVSRTKGLFFPDGIEMTLLCMQTPELLTELKKLLPAFFALHCFGNRSNKGFGSFTVRSINGEAVPEPRPEALLDHLPETCRAICYGTYQSRDAAGLDWESRLDDIQAASSIMKGGMNYSSYENGMVKNALYYKGVIFQYFMDYKTKGVHSEKAKIKRDILPNPKEDAGAAARYGKKTPGPNARFLYMRGILGLAQNFQYKSNNKNSISFRRGNVKVEGEEKDDSGKSLIARFENPVHFKPYGAYLLLIPQEIPTKLYGAEIRLTEAVKYGSGLTDTIRLPDARQFDLVEFLEYFAKRYQTDPDLRVFQNAYSPRPAKNVSQLLRRVKRFQTVRKEG